ncbi:hypothetical protein GU3_10325 [Oceanimonas sp. GK1]|uniref:hypothetical protein n=1 Tax=Oceanimonas sp. (strain GK1 / IBRC-M 10197) TaxID=511062 RepID=UPI0002495189|nr:hypothetical protein [Oceanimonas sp. GK1]AEY01821.1 hypothetical protein GU3_10325 [Oceanimonas sp. GK1]
MAITIYWQEQPEFGPGWVSAWVGGEVEMFPSMSRLRQHLMFEYDDYELSEVTQDNWRELYDAGVFRHG